MKTRKNYAEMGSKHGGVAIAAVVAIAVIAILCGSMLQVAMQDKQKTSAGITRSQALHSADAGIAHAISVLTSGTVPDEGDIGLIGDVDNQIGFGGGTYFTEILGGADESYTVTSTATYGQLSASVEAVVVASGGSVFDYAVFAGNDGSDPLYDLEMGGTGGQADDIQGDMFSGGNVVISDDAGVTGDILAGGTITGDSGTEGATQAIPDLAAQNYASTADFDVAAMFAGGSATYTYDSAGGYAYQMPESSPSHIFRKNPSDRSSDTATTLKDDYFLEDPYESVNADYSKDGSNAYRVSLSGISGEPGTSSNGKVFYIDGNLWVHNRRSYSLGIKHSEAGGVQVSFVVSGNIYFADNFFYQDKDKDGVAFIAMKDSGVADSGNIYFGDPVFGTLQAMQSFMYAENNFYDLNLDSSGSQTVDIYGNMSAGNQILVQRDYFGSHTKLSVEFDDRLKGGTLQIPGLPSGGSSGKTYSVTYWNQIATQ